MADDDDDLDAYANRRHNLENARIQVATEWFELERQALIQRDDISMMAKVATIVGAMATVADALERAAMDLAQAADE